MTTVYPPQITPPQGWMPHMFTEEQIIPKPPQVIDLTTPPQPSFDLNLPSFEACANCQIEIFTTTDGISYTDLFSPVHIFEEKKYCSSCFFNGIAARKETIDWANFLKAHTAMEEEVAKESEEMDLAILDLPAEILTNMSLAD
jgi:hypothetical protein